MAPGEPTSDPQTVGRFRDIRMRGFQDRTEVRVVLEYLDQHIQRLSEELVPLRESADRVLARDILSEVAVPSFDRAAMDGYALRALETFGASPYNPLEFRVIGEVLPGESFSGTLGPGETVRIMTGAPVPAGADAIVPAEAAEEEFGLVRVTEPVAPGKNVGQSGEDIAAGTLVLRTGRALRPQDIGVLASLGASPVPVVRRPRVAILITGNELLACGSRPQGFRIVDSNSAMLEALVRRDRGLPSDPVLIRDSFDSIRKILQAKTEDVILISGGSSVGKEDHAPRVLAELGRLTFHGLALRPASPAGLGFLDKRPVFLLPGNPVSCLCAYDFFAGPTIRRLGGRSMDWPYRRVELPLARKLVSAIGRVDYVRVSIRNDQVEPLATSGASILSSTTRADGFVIIPGDSEGLAAGEVVPVFLYDH